MRRTLVLAALAATIPATAARAHTTPPVPVDQPSELAGIVDVARAAWPGSPCTGRELVSVSDEIGINHGPAALGGATPEHCFIGLHPDLFDPGSRYLLCVVVVHEFGHLAGRAHEDDRWSIMYRYADWYPPCEAFGPAGVAGPAAPVDPPAGGIIPVTPEQELQIVQGGEYRTDQILAGRYRHYRGEATCEYAPPPEGSRSPTLTCTAAWRTKKRRYRATVVLREGVENVTVKTGRINARHHRGGRNRDRSSRRGSRS